MGEAGWPFYPLRWVFYFFDPGLPYSLMDQINLWGINFYFPLAHPINPPPDTHTHTIMCIYIFIYLRFILELGDDVYFHGRTVLPNGSMKLPWFSFYEIYSEVAICFAVG